jgi:hypothetical protein
MNLLREEGFKERFAFHGSIGQCCSGEKKIVVCCENHTE